MPRINTPPKQYLRGIDRIEALSDGVISFAITLMVLELIDPALAFFNNGNFSNISKILGEPLLVYILSFIVIAIMLVNHQSLMRLAPHATPKLFWLNAHLLFWITLVPVATAVLGAHLFQTLAVAFYGAVFTGSSVAFTLLHRHILLMRAKGSAIPMFRMRALYENFVATALCALSIPLAFVSTYLSLVIFVIIPCIYFLPRYEPESPAEIDHH